MFGLAIGLLLLDVRSGIAAAALAAVTTLSVAAKLRVRDRPSPASASDIALQRCVNLDCGQPRRVGTASSSQHKVAFELRRSRQD